MCCMVCEKGSHIVCVVWFCEKGSHIVCVVWICEKGSHIVCVVWFCEKGSLMCCISPMRHAYDKDVHYIYTYVLYLTYEACL